MNLFLVNVLLALAWAALSGAFTELNLLVGFVLGYLVLGVLRPMTGSGQYFTAVPRAIGFALFFLRELVLSNLRIASDVIQPHYRIRPGVIAIPIELSSDAQITVLANLITLTPGTLSLDVSADRKTLYIHAMHVEDIEALRRGIREGFERRVREVIP